MQKNSSFLAVIISSFFILAGCSSTSEQTRDNSLKLSNMGDYQGAARTFLNDKGEPRYNDNELENLLLVGKVFHDAGLWQYSYDAFEKAQLKLSWKADKIDTGEELVRLVGTTLTSDAFGDYTGRIYEGVMIDYYQTINQLMLANEDKVRIHLNRTSLRQENAEIQFTNFVAAVAKDNLSNDQLFDPSQYQTVRNGIDGDINLGVRQLPSAGNVEIRNPMADLLDAFLRYKGSSGIDRSSNKIQVSLRNADRVISAQNGYQKHFTPYKQVFESEKQPHIFIIFEDGQGPQIDEFRIDLPLFLVSDDALYSGIALPEFKPGKPSKLGLQVRLGEQSAALAPIADLNRMAGLEFAASYDKKVAKQIVSAIIKTVLQVAANKEIEKNTNPYIGFLGKVVTAGLQAAATKADTRHWGNLPNTIQGAILLNDGSGVLEFTQGGVAISSVNIPTDRDIVVYARSAGTSRLITSYIQILPLSETPNVEFSAP